MVTRDAVIDALRTVQDPDLHRDLVSLEMIRDLEISDAGAVKVRVVLTTPACPLKAKIENDVRQAIQGVAGVGEIQIVMDAEVRGRARSGGAVGVGAIPGVTHVIAVSSGKGGVGKSTVAVNLACALQQEGARVGLMDADVYGPNIPTMMGVMGQPTIETQPGRGEVFLPPSVHGMKVMSMGFLIEQDQPLVWRGPMLHNVISQFCHKVDWGQLDYLVVDMPPGTGDVQLSLSQQVPVTGAILVSTPQEVAMQDVRKAYAMFEKVKIPVLGFVENMSFFRCDGCEKQHFPFGKDGGHLLARKFNAPLLAQLPLVQDVREGGDEGDPVVLRHPDSEVALIFRTLARTIAQKISILVSEKSDPSQLIQIGKFE